jgi:hypothetical protein
LVSSGDIEKLMAGGGAKRGKGVEDASDVRHAPP